jgi:hypothetical protein
MRGFLFFLAFLFTVGFCGALGHDIWHASNEKNGIDLNKPFQFSALGWVWTHYDPDSYKWAHDNIDPDLWQGIIGPVLEQKSVIVFGLPALCIIGLLLLLKTFGLYPFEGEAWLSMRRGLGKSKTGGGSFSFGEEKKAKKVRNTRR